MVVTFGPTSHRVKARSLTLGATRWRLLQLLRHLGLCREEIEARLREEQEVALALERERQLVLLAEEAAARMAEEWRLAGWLEECEAARIVEERRAAQLLREKAAFEAMTPAQQAAWRAEEEIVSWLTVEDARP
jgi:hypothetical protein